MKKFRPLFFKVNFTWAEKSHSKIELSIVVVSSFIFSIKFCFHRLPSSHTSHLSPKSMYQDLKIYDFFGLTKIQLKYIRVGIFSFWIFTFIACWMSDNVLWPNLPQQTPLYMYIKITQTKNGITTSLQGGSRPF